MGGAEMLGVGVLISYAVSGMSSISSADKQLKGLFVTMEGGNATLTKLGRTMGLVAAGAIAMAAGMGMVNAAMSTVEAYADYEYEMAVVQGLIGATREEMVAFEDQSRAMARTTGYTSAQSMEAYYELLSAGLSANEAISMLEATLMGARVGQIETATSADMLTTAIRAFHYEAEDSMLIMDKLTLGARMSKIHIDEYNQAFGRGGAVMDGLNQSIEGTIALFGLMRTAGLSASSASMMMKMLGTHIMDMSDANAERLRNLGIELYDLQGNMRPLVDIFRDLYASMPDPQGALAQGLITEDMVQEYAQGRMKTYGDLFGMRAVAGVLSIKNAQMEVNGTLLEGAEVLESFMTTLETGAEGYTKSYFDILMDTWKMKLEVLGAIWNNIKLAIGGPLLTSLTPILDQIGAALEYVDVFLSSNPEIATAIGYIALVGGVLLALGGALVVVAAIVGMLAAIGGIGLLIGKVALVFAIIVAAVAAIGAAGYTIYAYWEQIKGFFIVLGDWLWGKFGFLVKIIVIIAKVVWWVLERVWAFFKVILVPILGVIFVALSGIIGIALMVLDWLWGVVQTVWAFVEAFATWDWETFQTELDRIWSGVGDDISTLADVFFVKVSEAITKIVDKAMWGTMGMEQGGLWEHAQTGFVMGQQEGGWWEGVQRGARAGVNYMDSNASGNTRITRDGPVMAHEGNQILQRGEPSSSDGLSIGNVNFYSYGQEDPEGFARRAFNALQRMMSEEMEAVQNV